MSPSEYTLYSNLEFYGAFLIFFGIPVFYLLLGFLVPKQFAVTWVICFILSSISIFMAMQYYHSYISQPISDYDYEHSSVKDSFGGKTNEGAVFLIFGIPMGIFATALVFGCFFAGRCVLKRVGLIK